MFDWIRRATQINKVCYKEFKDYEELVRETDKYDNRLQAEKEESSINENLLMPSLQQFLHQTLSYYGLLSIT
jgi:hypothetical protein